MKTEILQAHSPLGPSSADRWLNCPGSVLLLLTKAIQNPDTEYSALGTAAHTLTEWCRVHKVDASTYRGQVLAVGDFEFTVDQDMIDSVNAFVEYVEQWPGEPLYEQRVYLDLWVPGAFGTLDDARIEDGFCRVTDYKHGTGVQVYAQDNAQLKLYALGLYHDFGHLYNFDTFVLTIVQPRLDHVDVFETTLAELLSWAKTVVKPTAAIALSPGAPLKAGDHCRFCPARRVCKVRADYVADAVFSGNDFAKLDEPAQLAFLTNDDVARILPKLGNIKKWCDDLEDYALSEIAKGHAVGDWKLVEGRSNRVWKSSEETIYAGLSLEVDNPDELWEKKLVSPAKAEKLLGKKVDISDLIEKPPGKPKLAPGTDKRSSLAIDASKEFANLDAA